MLELRALLVVEGDFCGGAVGAFGVRADGAVGVGADSAVGVGTDSTVGVGVAGTIGDPSALGAGAVAAGVGAEAAVSERCR